MAFCHTEGKEPIKRWCRKEGRKGRKGIIIQEARRNKIKIQLIGIDLETSRMFPSLRQKREEI